MPEDRSVLGRPAPEPRWVWRYGPGDGQVADVYLPEGPAIAGVLLIHGGYWRPEYDRLHLRPMAAALAEAGYATALVEYARVPGDPDAAMLDLRTATTRFAAALDHGPPILVGHSAGGHLTLLLAAEPDLAVAGCLALAPVADLAEADRLDLDDGATRAFLGASAADRPDLDPLLRPAPTRAVTLLHGQADTLVPPDLSLRYHRATGARLVVLPGIAHFEPVDPLSPAWPSVLSELEALARLAGIE
jgi:acetyl esterase/lipase